MGVFVEVGLDNGLKQDSVSLVSNEMLQQTQRLLAWGAYQDSLKDVDKQVFQEFQKSISGLRAAFWLKVFIYLIQFSVISIALFWSLKECLNLGQGQPWLWIFPLVCLALLGILLFRNPLQSFNSHLVDLARIQIVLQGCTRQFNQVDTIFKQAFLENKVEIKTVEKYLAHVQKVIDGNIESLLQFMEEMHL